MIRALFIFLLVPIYCLSQNIKQQLLVKCDLLINNKSSNNIKITIVDEQLNHTNFTANKTFTTYLEYNEKYSILFEYENCQSQMLYFNNSVKKIPKDVVCNLTINLKESEDQGIRDILRIYYDEEIEELNYKKIGFN